MPTKVLVGEMVVAPVAGLRDIGMRNTDLVVPAVVLVSRKDLSSKSLDLHLRSHKVVAVAGVVDSGEKDECSSLVLPVHASQRLGCERILLRLQPQRQPQTDFGARVERCYGE